MCQDKKQRLIIKRGSGEPTIPVSSDHRNGDWNATDIYEGELYQDVDTGQIISRSGTQTVSLGTIPNEVMVLKARVYQSGTSAPTVVPYYNPFNYSLSTVRDAAGIYRITGFSIGAISEDFDNSNNHYEMRWSTNSLLGGSTLDIFPSTNTSVTIRSYNNTGVLDDNVILEFTGGTSAAWNVITITKYKL